MIMWLPIGTGVGWRWATPAETVAVPIFTLLSLKVTVPPGVAEAGEVTVTFAVNVTAEPALTVAGAALAASVVSPLVTVTVAAEDVLVLKELSPPYAAVTLWLPTVRLDVDSVACPDDTDPVPSVVEPSLNATLPVSVPDAGDVTERVALNVTD